MEISVIGTVVIPMLSLSVSVATAYFFLKDRRHARYQMESSYIEKLLDWHKEVVFLLVRLESSQPEFKSEKRSELSKLSALIEQGRFFFPNIVEDDYGAQKPLAYRGYRNIVLELLVGIYILQEGEEIDAEIIVNYRRSFTSAVFALVDPVKRLSDLSEMTAKKLLNGQSVYDYVDAEWR